MELEVVGVKLPKDLKKEFFEASKVQDITPSQVMRQLIRIWLEEQKTKAGK